MRPGRCSSASSPPRIGEDESCGPRPSRNSRWSWSSRARSIPQARCSRRRSTRSNAARRAALADALVSRAVYLVYVPPRRGVRRPAARARARGCAWAIRDRASCPPQPGGRGARDRSIRWSARRAEGGAAAGPRARGPGVGATAARADARAAGCLGRWEEAVPQAEALFAGVQDVDATVADTDLATIAAARGDESIRSLRRWPPRPASRVTSISDASTVVLAPPALDRSEHG